MSGLSPNPLQAALNEHAIASGDMIILAGSRAFYDAKDRRDKARRLIVQRAAAHDELLAALRDVVESVAITETCGEVCQTSDFSAARAALKKATGDAS